VLLTRAHCAESTTRHGTAAGAVLLKAAVLIGAGGVFLAARLHGPPPTPGLLAYDRTLGRHVRGGLVDYGGLASDRADLDQFLKELASVDSTELHARSRYDRMAFWINAYNALTLDLVLGNLHGPDGKGPRIKSIRDIPDAFSRPRWVVAGDRRSLDGIEKGILPGQFHDPRIHFALVCAARSCPMLRAHPYDGDSLDVELKAAARAFLADTTRNNSRIRQGAIRLSKIFDWYGQEFANAAPQITPSLFPTYGPGEESLLTSIALDLPRQDFLALRKGHARIEFLPYDWSLNDASTRR
jgi:Protein of unknown function, DUF547